MDQLPETLCTCTVSTVLFMKCSKVVRLNKIYFIFVGRGWAFGYDGWTDCGTSEGQMENLCRPQVCKTTRTISYVF